MAAAPFLNYIGGAWVPAASGATFESRNPADTTDLVGAFPDSSADDVARAVEAASAGYRPSDPQIAWHLARFIEEVRGLPADPIVVRQNWLRAYEFTTDRGALALNDHARANDPFTRVGEDQVSVEVSSVIRASPDSFRVAWSERHYENGQLARTERWTAILTIVIDPPRTADRLRANPLGIYVNAINWSREMSQ